MKKEKISSYIKKIDDENFSINLFDLNNITKIVYGSPIGMCLVQKNSTLTIDVQKTLTEEENFELQSAKYNERAEFNRYYIILNDLCKKGYLQQGRYQIQAYW